ncbi:hypothetical protein PRIPAC_87861 [Pristionchus pacificus]|uniref:Ribosomal protein n=1 Tax=Pristionchus pacificus TaxID=54126 RepID=A0A2A6CY22_PRIPA|nr:hypothetical protein PRIPAC_87861 [Pristionchus pacificus]|eukprot:PDM83010.1 ribosomal protein [Pristionchus pacificus]
MLALLLLPLLVSTTSGCIFGPCIFSKFTRKVTVDGTLSCLSETGVGLPMDNTRISLWEEDSCTVAGGSGRRKKSHTVEGGRFHFEEETSELTHALTPNRWLIRFYLKVDVLCWRPDSGAGRFVTACADKQLKERYTVVGYWGSGCGRSAEAKKARLQARAEARAAGKKEEVTKRPNMVRFGIQNVTRAIETREAQLVLIAHDVDPLEVVIFLPALCR